MEKNQGTNLKESFEASNERYSNIHKQSVFPKVIEANKGIAKEQKQCILCRNNVGGLVEKKKYVCNFCYNAVCQNCSPLKCNHPETMKEERVCMQCYIFAIEDQVRDEVKGQINTEFGADEQNKRIKESLKSEINEYEKELKILDVDLQNAHEELERLKRLKSKKFEERNNRVEEEKLKSVKEIETLKQRMAKAKEDIKKKKEIMSSQEKEIEAIKKHLVFQEEKILKLKKEADSERQREVVFRKSTQIEETFPEKEKLVNELNELKSLIMQLQHEQEELKSQLGLIKKTS